jgi:hypothetical protein
MEGFSVGEEREPEVTASAAQIVTRRRTYPRSRSRIIRFPEAAGLKSASVVKQTGGDKKWAQDRSTCGGRDVVTDHLLGGSDLTWRVENSNRV